MKRIVLASVFFLTALEGLFFICKILGGLETGNAVFGSMAALFPVVGIVILSLAFLFLAWQIWKQSSFSQTWLASLQVPEKFSCIAFPAFLFLIVGMAFSQLPGYWFGRYEVTLGQSRPFFDWFTLFLGQLVLGLAVVRWTQDREFALELISENRPLLFSGGVFVLAFLGIWGFVAVTRIGITPDVAYWNEAGIPILGLQLLFSLAISLGIGAGLSRLQTVAHPVTQKRIGKIQFIDLVILLAIWGLAAGVWLAEPMQQSFNAPRPSPPAYEYYPFSDSTAYDLGSQFALIGQGINNNLLTDKPLYMLFLTLLHAVGGQSVSVVTGLQVLVLAMFPVTLFLLGMEMHSRGLGILVALLAVFKERNAIAAVLDIQVSHVKLMITEVPTALLVSMAALLMFKWAKRDSLFSGSLPFWVGGAIGAAVLMRANAFTLLPLALMIPFLASGRNWRKVIVLGLSVSLGFSLVVLPWLLTNRGADGRTYLQVKLDGVLERYRPPVPGGSGWSPTRLGDESPGQFAMLSASSDVIFNSNSQFSSGTEQETTPLDFVLAHFFHNQIAALFSLPMTWDLHDLSHTVDSHLWDKNWSGSLTSENGMMLFLNLSLLALGFSLAWRHWQWAGLIPALVEILYFMANALARTSGSRYLVPADWAVYFYYSLGLIQFAEWLLTFVNGFRFSISESLPSLPPARMRQAWAAPVLSLLFLGMLMPLSGVLIPQRYPSLDKNDAYKTLESQVSLTKMGLTQQEINRFLRNPDSVVFQGRLLYPRYFLAGKGLCKKCYVLDAAFGARPYPRLTFVGLGPFSAGVIVEMESLPANFRSLNLSESPDVWVIGCKEHEEVFGIFKGFYPSVRGLIIAISSEKGIQVYSQPNQKLNCE